VGKTLSNRDGLGALYPPIVALGASAAFALAGRAILKQTSEPRVSAIKAGETELLPDSIAGFCKWSTSHGPALYKSKYQHKC
jgi:hypothetical protein